MIDKVVDDIVLCVWLMFWGFCVMVGLGFLMLVLFGLLFWSILWLQCKVLVWLLCWVLWMFLVLWIVIELGWVVVEYGCQLWIIYGVLFMYLSVLMLSEVSLYGLLVGFIGFYMLLLIVEMYLMIWFVCQGLGSFGIGCYDFEVVYV